MTTESSNVPTATTASAIPSVTVGVLALQGSFREHCSALRRLPGVEAREVRTAEDLAACDGLIIPGGESTTMALVAERWGLVAPLREYASSGKPLWGTCAGLIFLANRAVGASGRLVDAASLNLSTSLPTLRHRRRTKNAPGQKEGGQALLGGLDALVSRNFFGAQVDSFEATLPTPECLEPFLSAAGSASCPPPSPSSRGQGHPGFRAVFIRAPAVLETGPGVEVLAELELTDEQVDAAAAKLTAKGDDAAPSPSSRSPVPRRVAVAVRQGNLLATSFHPELTDDSRWHALFASGVREAKEAEGRSDGVDATSAEDKAAATAAAEAKLLRKVNLPADLPVLAPGQKY